jgi:hypothetical protein
MNITICPTITKSKHPLDLLFHILANQILNNLKESSTGSGLSFWFKVVVLFVKVSG